MFIQDDSQHPPPPWANPALFKLAHLGTPSPALPYELLKRLHLGTLSAPATGIPVLGLW